MRTAAAGILDALAAAVLGFLAFHLADTAVPCTSQSSCAPLAPAVILAIIIALLVYFAGSHLLWRQTPGQRLFGIADEASHDNDSND